MVAVGTGQAIKNAANGDGDVLFVHSKPSEEKFVAEVSAFPVPTSCTTTLSSSARQTTLRASPARKMSLSP